MRCWSLPSFPLPAMLRAAALLALSSSALAAKKPLQVVIMAGQSNMVGHGYAEGSTLHWNATSSNPCGGTAGGCVVSAHATWPLLGAYRP